MSVIVAVGSHIHIKEIAAHTFNSDIKNNKIQMYTVSAKKLM